MIWNFWKKQEVPKPLVYDKLTDEYLNGDPKLIWQHQISGNKNFEYCDFLGALTDLSGDPNWQLAFKDLPNSGLFTKRLGEFFELNQVSLDAGDGKSYLYFAPRHNKKTDAKLLLNAAEEFIKLGVKVAKKANEKEFQKYLEGLDVKLAENKSEEIQYRVGATQTFNEIIGSDVSLYEIWTDLFSENQSPEWDDLHYCLSEASYGLAADFYLVHWLMQDFYDVGLDTQAYFDFFWRFNGSFYQEDETLYIFQANTS